MKILYFSIFRMALVSREVLKKYLISKLPKDGKMSPMAILKDTKDANFIPGNFETSDTITRLVQPEDRLQVKEFMRDHYFTSAVVPAAIKIRDTWPKYQYLDNELDIMLDTPSCFMTVTKNSEKLVGAKLSTIWLTDPDYDAFPTDPLDWLNLAGEVALESTEDPDLRAVIWRNFQWLLIYHQTQAVAQVKGCPFYLYGGIGFTLPEFRAGEKKGVPLFLNHGQQWADSQKSIFSFVGTYPGFEKLTHKALPGMFKRLSYVPYQDLTSVNLHTDQPNLQGLPDGMTLMVSQK